MAFAFQQQDVSLVFEAEPQLLLRLKANQNSADQHLNVSALLSQDDVVVLQSPTASTLVEVRALHERVYSAGMTTQYFGDFVDHDAFIKRGTYTREKTKRLIEILASAGARMVFCGLVTLARWPISQRDHEDFRKKLSGQFSGLQVLAEGQVPFDFIMRASRRPDDTRFSNIQLSWYEQRSLTVPIGSKVAQGGAFTIHDWDMAVTDAGLELRFDQNNKQALRAGRRNWTPEDFQGLVEGYLTDLPGAVKSVVNYLGGNDARS